MVGDMKSTFNKINIGRRPLQYSQILMKVSLRIDVIFWPENLYLSKTHLYRDSRSVLVL